jgi:hypothetical protein
MQGVCHRLVISMKSKQVKSGTPPSLLPATSLRSFSHAPTQSLKHQSLSRKVGSRKQNNHIFRQRSGLRQHLNPFPKPDTYALVARHATRRVNRLRGRSAPPLILGPPPSLPPLRIPSRAATPYDRPRSRSFSPARSAVRGLSRFTAPNPRGRLQVNRHSDF